MAPAPSWEVAMPVLGQKGFFSRCLHVSEQQAGPGHRARGRAGQGGTVPAPSLSRSRRRVAGQRGVRVVRAIGGFGRHRGGGASAGVQGPPRLSTGPAFG